MPEAETRGWTSEALDRLLAPSSVAVVGASRSPGSGRRTIENLKDVGFAGKVVAVNPRYDEVLGYPCAPSLTEVGFAPDAVVVCVNRKLAVEVVRQAADVGAGGAVVFGIGFAEGGPEGEALQRTLASHAARGGIPVIGPNCQGLINYAARTPLYMDSARAYAPGGVGLIAQSGSVATALLNNARGVRWRYAFSTGNEAVVDAGDLLGWMVDDPECKVAALFLETIRDPDKFFAHCDRARERELPVVMMKTGRTEASRRAAQAHSGALAAPEWLVDARLQRHGVLRVPSLEDLLETAIALQLPRKPRTGRIASLSSSGGVLELALDAAAAAGLEHRPIEGRTHERLAELLPTYPGVSNPVDYWGMEDEDAGYQALVEVLSDDPEIDIVIGLVDQSLEPTGNGRYQRSYDAAMALAGRADALQVLVDVIGGGAPPQRVEEALAAGVLIVSGMDTGMRALSNLVAYAAGRETGPPAATAPVDSARVQALISDRDKAFSGMPALQLLKAAGLDVVETEAVTDPASAVKVADRLGYPVVLKLGDAEVTHKTELAGVVTGIESAERLRSEAQRLFAGGHRELLVQRQLAGTEVLLGLTSHEQLGTFIVVGTGGVFTELLQDAVVAPIGLGEGEAEALLMRLKGAKLLDGARGAEPADRAALVHAIEQLDALAQLLDGRVVSLDANPVMVDASGATVVDAVVVPGHP